MTATRTKRLLSVHTVAERGGSDFCLLRMVGRLADDGWDCHIVLPAASPLAAEFAAAGATLHRVPMRRVTGSGPPWYWLAFAVGWPITVVRLTCLARRVDAEVIHSNSLHCWYGWAVAALLGKAHVWHCREIVVQSAAALRLEQWLCRHWADRVIAASSPVAAQLAGSPVIVVHDIPDATEFRPSRAGRFRARVGIGDDVPLVGAAGRIDTWKGFDVLLAAAAQIHAQRPEATLVVAGGPVPGKEGYAAQLADRASQLDGVRWLGMRHDIADLLADLDLFVLPSTEPEPFASVLVEALACGVPVVATDHGGSPEALADFGASGRLIPPKDPVALAAAVGAMLPPGCSDVARRQGRPAMLVRQSPTFAEVFDAVLAAGRGRGRSRSRSRSRGRRQT